MAGNSRKQDRKLAAEQEIRKREDALGVPDDRQVFAFKRHYTDEGGPREMTVKQFQMNHRGFPFEQWRDRLRAADECWDPVEVEPAKGYRVPRKRPVGDFSEFGELMIFSARAASELQHLLQPCGIFLPLRCAEGDYVGFRLDAVVDALDVARTRAHWMLPGTESASSIYTYAFHTERLGTKAMFRIPQHFEILVSPEFVTTVRAAELSGFRFCRVWPAAMAWGSRKWF